MSKFDEQIDKRKIENIDKLIGEKFGNYSKYIIQERALPDLRDGLKPVQRRILFAMSKLNLTHQSAFKKSARVVGDVIGKYHPHGDTSVYDAMVRMAQTWKTNMPLVDMHGNKGSIDGDSPAAMRYTESRLSPISDLLLLNIEKNIVPYTLNFDDTEKEPTVFPALFPNLLVNGSMGIASGYSTNIPPHNFNEIIDALIYVLENLDDVKFSKLKKIVNGPDFPTGGIIVGKQGFEDAYREGKGKIILRATYNTSKKNDEITINEIPFETSKIEIIKKIRKIIDEKQVPGIVEVRDDTDRIGLKITILTKQNANLSLIMNYLFKNTDLEKAYHANLIAIQDKKPVLLGLRDIFENFANFQIKIYTNLFQYELLKLEKRLEIVRALIKVISALDETINIIRKSTDKNDAKNNLILKFNLNDNQAEAIVNLRLYRLTSTDIKKLYEDEKYLMAKIQFYKKGLKNQSPLVKHIIQNLQEINQKFVVPRKTIILSKFHEEEINEIDLVSKKNIYFGITYEGYVKVVDFNSRLGINLDEYKLIESDFHVLTKETVNLNNAFIFTTTGKYFAMPIYKFNEQRWSDLGEHLSKYVSVDVNDHIIASAFFKDVKNLKSQLVISTKLGKIKRININELENLTTKRGSKYIALSSPEDSIVSIDLVENNDYYVSTVTKNGYLISYSLEEIPVIGANANGVKNIALSDGDYVVGTILVKNDYDEIEDTKILLLTKYARAKKIRFKDLNITSRGTKGIRILRTLKAQNDEIINYINISKNNYVDIILKDKTKTRLLTKEIVSISSISSGFGTILDWNHSEIVQAFCGKELISSNFNYNLSVGEKEENDYDEQSEDESIINDDELNEIIGK